MRNRPFVTVIIPTYNREQTLPRAINSVLSQTYKNWKLLIVDDCSTDNTLKMLREKYEDFDNIESVQTSENKGYGMFARNVGIAKSTTPLIAFLDSDDVWEKNKLEKQVSLFEKDVELGLVYCEGILTDGRKQNKIKNTLRGCVEKDLFLNLKGLGASNSGIMIRREVVQKVGMYDTRFKHQDDLDFFVRIARFFKIDFIEGSPTTIFVDDMDRISNNNGAVMLGEIFFVEKHEERIKELGVYHHVLRKLARKYALYGKDLLSAYKTLYSVIKYKPTYFYAYVYMVKLPLLYLKKK